MSERLSSIRLTARCFARFITHGFARAVSLAPKSIVIVQFGKLGDMVCTTPMFRAIKKTFPDTRVIVVGDKVGGQVLAGNKDVDRYIFCGRNIELALQELCAERPNVGITIGPSSRAFALLYLADIPTIIAPRIEGGRSSEGRLYRLLRRLGILVPHTIGSYAPREYLRLLEPIGIVADDTQKHLSISLQTKQKIEEFWIQQGLVGKFVVGISPSAGNKIKQWPPNRFAAVANHLHKVYGAAVLIIAGPNDQKEVGAMRAALTVPVVDSSGAFSIEELKAVVGKLSLFISVDTGPIYIAEAFDVSTIDIVGPVDENEQPPIGPHHIVMVPTQRTSPELYVMNPYHYNYAEARRQVESITVEHVKAAIDLLVPKIQARV